jgi:hypothetical protein
MLQSCFVIMAALCAAGVASLQLLIEHVTCAPRLLEQQGAEMRAFCGSTNRVKLSILLTVVFMAQLRRVSAPYDRWRVAAISMYVRVTV